MTWKYTHMHISESCMNLITYIWFAYIFVWMTKRCENNGFFVVKIKTIQNYVRIAHTTGNKLVMRLCLSAVISQCNYKSVEILMFVAKRWEVSCFYFVLAYKMLVGCNEIQCNNWWVVNAYATQKVTKVMIKGICAPEMMNTNDEIKKNERLQQK